MKKQLRDIASRTEIIHATNQGAKRILPELKRLVNVLDQLGSDVQYELGLDDLYECAYSAMIDLEQQYR